MEQIGKKILENRTDIFCPMCHILKKTNNTGDVSEDNKSLPEFEKVRHCFKLPEIWFDIWIYAIVAIFQ